MMIRWPARQAPSRVVACVVLGAAILVFGNRVGASDAMSPSSDSTPDEFAALRLRMVREQIERRGIHDPAVLRVMSSVPRHRFVPPAMQHRAYEDAPLPIGEAQTISQPYIVAFMTEAIRPRPEDRVLEVGTGSGYQAAVLAGLVARVYSIEIRPMLADRARAILGELGCSNVELRTGDGYAGWPEAAPFDAIVVTAAPDEVPERLIEQLRPGGRLVIPVGQEGGEQRLIRLTRTSAGLERETLLPVRFVPMIGERPHHQ